MILRTIKYADQIEESKFSVFKMTGIARFALLEKIQDGRSLSKVEKDENDKVKARVERLCEAAVKKRIRLMIDAEDFELYTR